ncbi:MAG: hypothetical protein ACE5I1_10320 [bacterium]
MFACQNKTEENAHDAGNEGEEPGVRLAIDERYNDMRNGVRLILAFDEAFSSFTGTLENTAHETKPSVRVEVHLSDGAELGPTPPVDLAPGEKLQVTLPAAGHVFEWWKAHAETSEGEGEHAGEHEAEGEHDADSEHEGGGEHKGGM